MTETVFLDWCKRHFHAQMKVVALVRNLSVLFCTNMKGHCGYFQIYLHILWFSPLWWSPIPLPCVWAVLGDSLLTNKMWQKWWSMTSESQTWNTLWLPSCSPLNHLLWRSQLSCCEDTQPALQSGPHGKKLKSPFRSLHKFARHVSEPWKQILKLHSSFQGIVALANILTITLGETWARIT